MISNQGGAFIVFDLTKKETFENCKKWYERAIGDQNKSKTIILIGNKCDLSDKREIAFETAKKFCEERSIFYFETSAKLNVGINEAFYKMVQLSSNILYPSNYNDQKTTFKIL
jgi:GTPase SAR1 family protein